MNSMTTKPALVILAAGASSRLGECKALVDLGGLNPLQRLQIAAAALDDKEPVVVTGAHSKEIALAAPKELALLDNRDWQAGRTGGIALACRSRPNRDLVLAPVDTPLVGAEVFGALLESWLGADAPARGWLGPSIEHEGRIRSGHPIVLGRELAAEIAQLDPDMPLRDLRQRADPLWLVPVQDAAILDDLDTPQDLAALRLRLTREREAR